MSDGDFFIPGAAAGCYAQGMCTTSLTHRLRGALVALGALLLPGTPLSSAPAPAPLKRVKLAKDLYFETEGKQRRVIVVAQVCLREGQLEGLLCRKNTKEHEYILTADLDARDIHQALILAGAKEGSPVQFYPRYKPAHGTRIAISVRYERQGKQVTVPAQSWIKNAATGKALDSDWVFAGSRLVPNPLDKDKPRYLANDGDVICLCNMDTAMLDLPVRSPKKFDSRIFEAFTERIPPLNTDVEVILTPRK